jgi:hypothetical protein
MNLVTAEFEVDHMIDVDAGVSRCRTTVLGGHRIEVLEGRGSRWLVDQRARKFLRVAAGQPVRVELLTPPWSSSDEIKDET